MNQSEKFYPKKKVELLLKQCHKRNYPLSSCKSYLSFLDLEKVSLLSCMFSTCQPNDLGMPCRRLVGNCGIELDLYTLNLSIVEAMMT